MIIIRKPGLLEEFMSRQRAAGYVTGFVPTMGALHRGHLELVAASRGQCHTTVVSIFVNPTQFNDPRDFQRYPKTLDKDILMLGHASADVLFVPDAEDVYPEGSSGLETYELGYLETILEGKYRPGHFQGVCQVMNRLLTLVAPDRLFMGQKDYQQCMVVKRLLELTASPVTLIKCPTVREPDGLAMSSRNVRLRSEHRAIAPLIYQTLQTAASRARTAGAEMVQQEGLSALSAAGFRPDYLELADAGTLTPAGPDVGSKRLVILAAAFLGEIRLIDNLEV